MCRCFIALKTLLSSQTALTNGVLLLAYTANMQTSLIGLEACSGAHFFGRALHKQGPRCPADSSPVCEALREVEQERLHRRGGDRRGRKRQTAAFRPRSAGQIVRGGEYLRLGHESGLLHRKIGCEVLMELGRIPDACNRTRRDRPFWGHHGIMK
jgi:hypothetical protein